MGWTVDFDLIWIDQNSLWRLSYGGALVSREKIDKIDSCLYMVTTAGLLTYLWKDEAQLSNSAAIETVRNAF